MLAKSRPCILNCTCPGSGFYVIFFPGRLDFIFPSDREKKVGLVMISLQTKAASRVCL